MNIRFTLTGAMKVLVLAGVLFLDSAYAAEKPVVKSKVGSHYVLIKPDTTKMLPACQDIQDRLFDFLINEKTASEPKGRLFALKLSKKYGCEYEPIKLSDDNVHISLLPIATSADVDASTLVETLKDRLNAEREIVPGGFRLDKVEAFLPAVGPQNRIFIVIRTPSITDRGFFKLSNAISEGIGIKPQIAQFKAHASLATLTKTNGVFTQQECDALNGILEEFTDRLNESEILGQQIDVEEILFSEFKGKKHNIFTVQ
jgi:hypothetical protein